MLSSLRVKELALCLPLSRQLMSLWIVYISVVWKICLQLGDCLLGGIINMGQRLFGVSLIGCCVIICGLIECCFGSLYVLILSLLLWVFMIMLWWFWLLVGWKGKKLVSNTYMFGGSIPSFCKQWRRSGIVRLMVVLCFKWSANWKCWRQNWSICTGGIFRLLWESQGVLGRFGGLSDPTSC